MARTDKCLEACYALQRDLEREAQLVPRTLRCFAGLYQTAVPVRVGDNKETLAMNEPTQTGRLMGCADQQMVGLRQ